mmetsp:Transcript_1139/g.1850  ORF Transcript_1139/g.1850 Transcript_1139/m.1850 type:complete len:167 (+) Transcript_1139:71-571(+)
MATSLRAYFVLHDYTMLCYARNRLLGNNMLYDTHTALARNVLLPLSRLPPLPPLRPPLLHNNNNNNYYYYYYCHCTPKQSYSVRVVTEPSSCPKNALIAMPQNKPTSTTPGSICSFVFKELGSSIKPKSASTMKLLLSETTGPAFFCAMRSTGLPPISSIRFIMTL